MVSNRKSMVHGMSYVKIFDMIDGQLVGRPASRLASQLNEHDPLHRALCYSYA